MFFYLCKNPESNRNETFKISTETINEKHKNIPKFVPYHFISSTSTHWYFPVFPFVDNFNPRIERRKSSTW